MANYEKNGIFTNVDESGNTYELYPQTKAELVEGLSLFGPVTTSGSGSAYTATVDGINALTNGVKVTIIPHTNSTTAAPTLNINELGAKSIRQRVSTNTTLTVQGPSDNWLVSGKPVTLMYNGLYWVTDYARPDANGIYGTVPVEKGGTGGTTAAEALANLGLTTESWTFTLEDGSTIAKEIFTK